MKSATRKLMPVIFLVILIISLSNTVWACSYIEQSLEENFNRSDYVFSAMVIATRLKGRERTEAKEDAKQPDWSSADEVVILFDPIENYKGDSSELNHLTTFISELSCGVPMWPGQSWVFFVQNKEFVVLGGGSRKYYPSSFDVRVLKRLRNDLMLEGYNKSLNADASDAGAG